MNRPDVIVSEAGHVGRARMHAVAAAERAGLAPERIPKVALATTELATNLVKHACPGVVTCTVEPGRLDVLSLDTGPGIRRIADSMRDGYSTTGTLGTGLGAARRAADVFDLYSIDGVGTAVLAAWREPVGGLPFPAVGAAMTAALGEVACGDQWSAWYDDDLVTVAVSDGLGHGEPAQAASEVVLRAVDPRHREPPAAMLNAIDPLVARTRGAAVAIAQVAAGAGRVRFCGVGNVVGRFLPDSAAPVQRLVSRPGIVGTRNAVGTVEFAARWDESGWLIMHTDGVSDRWELRDWPGLLRHDPAIVAGWILARSGRGRDDACVVVVTGGADR